MPGFAKKCPFVKQKVDDDVRMLDYRRSGLQDIPTEVFNKERTLEELYADSNQIRDLPRELFYCHGLRKLSISDNEITSIPPAISSLSNLEELDLSKNGIIDVPDSIKGCKYLRSIDVSVNPLGKLPEGITYLNNLTYLYLNDTFLDFLPGSFGRMVTLKILELRENHLKTLPHSFSRLVQLERLDIGNNEFTELSDVIGGLKNLLELWCDSNQIATINQNIGNLKQLMFLDASNNQLQELPEGIEGCVALADLHLTSNSLTELPSSIGNLHNLTTLKADDNHLTHLPATLGGLSSLSELNLSANDLEELPPSIGLLRNLRTFYADENMLEVVPAEIGSCSGITVLSLRGNKLTYIPDELGRIPRLRVLNLSDNLINYLPFSIIKLKELQALWLSENQTRPLIPLQSEYDEAGRKILTCYLLPQGQMKSNDERAPLVGDSDSFHASMCDEERLRRQQIHFDFAYGSDEEGKLVRCPTPYPKEMREKVRHARNLALRQMISVGDRGQPHELGGVTGAVGAAVSGAVGGPVGGAVGPVDRSMAGDFSEEQFRMNKAYMPHRMSVPEVGDPRVFLRVAKLQNTAGVASLSRGSGSVPDLTTEGKEITAVAMSDSPALRTYNEIFGKQITPRHRGRRSSRMRDYDSDTGYRSEGETLHLPRETMSKPDRETNSEVFSVQSQPLPRGHTHHQQRPRGREVRGYASDLEGYSNRGSFPTANAAAAAFKRQHHLSHHPAQSLPYNLDSTPAHAISDLSKSFHSHSPSRQETFSYGSRPRNEEKPYYMHPTNDPMSIHRTMSNNSINKFPGNAAQNYSRGNNSYPQDSAVISVSNDELYQQVRGGSYYQHPHLESSSDNTTLNHFLSSHQLTPKQFNPNDSPFQAETNPGPTAQLPGHRSFKQNTPEPQSKLNFSQIYPPSLDHRPSTISRRDLHNLGERNTSPSYSHRTNTPSPSVFPKDSFFDQNNHSLNQTLPSTTRLCDSPSSAAILDHRSGKLYTVPEQRSTSQRSLTGQAAMPGHPLATPPPYTSTPPYRKPENKNPAPRTHRLSSDSSSSRVDSPHSASGISAGAASFGLPNVINNRSEPSPCGFHGSKPYSDLPSTSVEKLTFSDYADIDQISQGCYHSDKLSKPRLGPFQFASGPGSTSSQICSASQIGPESRRNDPSNSSDSRSDSHNYSSSRESPYSGIPSYQSPQPSSRQDRLSDPLFGSLGARNLADLTITPSQEQCSQVSSSTDSGYGHGHPAYDYMGDYSKVSVKSYPKQGSQRSHSSEVNTINPQRQNPMQTSDGASTRDINHIKDNATTIPDPSVQEHTDQFQVTIHKNPDLGFSIAGGIGSHGNPYKENDIGIFVTKVIPDGPASKLLRPGDKILQVNNLDFQAIDHSQAVAVLKTSTSVALLVERIQKVNLV